MEENAYGDRCEYSSEKCCEQWKNPDICECAEIGVLGIVWVEKDAYLVSNPIRPAIGTYSRRKCDGLSVRRKELNLGAVEDSSAPVAGDIINHRSSGFCPRSQAANGIANQEHRETSNAHTRNEEDNANSNLHANGFIWISSLLAARN